MRALRMRQHTARPAVANRHGIARSDESPYQCWTHWTVKTIPYSRTKIRIVSLTSDSITCVVHEIACWRVHGKRLIARSTFSLGWTIKTKKENNTKLPAAEAVAGGRAPARSGWAGLNPHHRIAAVLPIATGEPPASDEYEHAKGLKDWIERHK